MKLRCETHKARVMVLTTRTVVHRKDGEKCDTKNVVIGNGVIPVNYMWLSGTSEICTLAING